jgi:hypothetical protein
MSYARCFPDVSQAMASPAANRTDSAAALTFAGWTEDDARRRIATLLRCGWSARQLALTFGVDLEEIDRLAGERDQPIAQRSAAMTEEAAS